MVTFADELYEFFEYLDLKDGMMVGHSTGGGEVTQVIGRHGTSRISKAAILSAIPPLMLKTKANPNGLPLEVFDGFRAAMVADPAAVLHCLAGAHDHTKVSPEADRTKNLKTMDIPNPIIHGEDNQIVPIGASAHMAIKLLPKGVLKIYPKGVYALPNLNVEVINQDLLGFLKS